MNPKNPETRTEYTLELRVKNTQHDTPWDTSSTRYLNREEAEDVVREYLGKGVFDARLVELTTTVERRSFRLANKTIIFEDWVEED